MKKLTLFGLIFALLLSLVGCSFGDRLTAFGLYKRAFDKINDAGGFEADCDAAISFGLGGLGDFDTAFKMNIRKNGENSRSEVSVTDGGSSVTTIIGSDVFVESDGAKLRYTIAENSEETESAGGLIPSLAEEIFENLEVVKNDDGTKSVTVSLDSETVEKLLADAAGQQETGITFDGAVMTMNFDERSDLDTMNISCDASYTVLGFTLSGRLTLDYKFINLGTAPEILPPDDPDSFEPSGEYQGPM